MKIKTKKQLNLPQLFEWGFKNEIRNKEFICNELKAKSVIFNLMGWAEFSDELSYDPTDTFTVEVEEEITEDTEFRHIVFIDDCDLSASYENNSINDIKYGKDKEFHAYIDGEFKLIWRDGKLVE
ncbi:hypothetical protein ABLV98_05890 [Staphylococcus sp. 50Mo3-1]|uniref:hypothetical protein n=1 Tax=Staphylococcus TaxID=1279 RepID=UPI0033D5476D